ncbi:hypothetical protein Acr_17g0013980 [Actinidia rufa]|uniref:Uncharacterized protein n=1 Tax=Actinidia rufa TaxID=165716 RepID=A0A7J0G4X7_9ERIC|nr:hypothetical protein Acr_17g0013980 [Actinidia rufa]
MSSRINLGDEALEHSLPSWVSDHLGEKSYITDDAIQSPSLPFEGSPPSNSSDYIEHPKMDTSNLIKEGDITSAICPATSSSVSTLSAHCQTRGGTTSSEAEQEPAQRITEQHERMIISEKRCNKLPVLTENEAKRMAEVLGKIKLGGYFKVSKVLASKTFQKYFARSRMEISSSGGENTTSGDESESYPSRGNLQRDSPSRSDLVECVGVIRGDIGRIARRAFLNIPDLPLLRWLGGKVQNPFSNLFPSGLTSRSDSRSESVLDSGLSFEIKSNAMSLRISLSTLTKKVGEKKAATKDVSSVATSQPPLKGIVIQEKRPRDDAHDLVSTKKGKVDNSKGKEAMLPSPTQEDQIQQRGEQRGCANILNGVILPADKEKVDQFTTDELVTKSFHALGQVLVVLVSALAFQSQDHQNDYHFQLARADSAELEIVKAQNRALKAESQLAELAYEKLAQAKELAIDDFKSSNDFKDAVTDSVATYFGEGFEFCKRQLFHHHPNLGANMVSMEMDTNLAEEEEAAKVGEKGEENEGEVGPTP